MRKIFLVAVAVLMTTALGAQNAEKLLNNITKAEAAAADAEESAQEAQNVFQIAGDTSFSMDPVTRKVTMHITES